MNINVLALNKAMDLAGKGTKAGYCRTISPQHYCSAAGLAWYSARSQLREYAKFGIVVAKKNGTFYVNAMDFDD